MYVLNCGKLLKQGNQERVQATSVPVNEKQRS